MSAADYTPEVGDRVRVVLEGEVTTRDSYGFSVGNLWVNPNLKSAAISVEKIEPPVDSVGNGSND